MGLNYNQGLPLRTARRCRFLAWVASSGASTGLGAR
jgi:hypothetical protein